MSVVRISVFAAYLCSAVAYARTDPHHTSYYSTVRYGRLDKFKIKISEGGVVLFGVCEGIFITNDTVSI